MAADFFANWGVPNTFQNLNVSSPAADATVHPSGLCSKIKSKPKKTFSPYYHNTTIINPNQLITSENFIHTWAMNKTREVCPMSSAILTIDGYFQSVNWFWVNPWEHSNSLSFLFHSNEHTWEPVSTELRQAPVWVFQNLMHWSLSPPPEASRLLWNGHQARALTAPCGPQSGAPTGSGSGLQLMSPSTIPDVEQTVNASTGQLLAWARPLEHTDLLSVSLASLDGMIPGPHIIVDYLAIHTASC